MSLQSVLNAAEDVIEHTQSLISGYTVNDDTKHKMMAALLSLALEHYQSIIMLIRNNKHGSASALGRPLFEAQYRTSWMSLCCSLEEAEAINTGVKKFKQVPKLAKAIDRAIGGTTFQNVCEQNLNTLHDFTHGGMSQLGRRFNQSGYIEVSFNEDELTEFIQSSGMSLAMSCMAFFAGIEDETKAQKAREYIVNFPEFN